MKCVFAAVALVAVAQASSENAAANPIRKVVTMLQRMQKTVEAEGKAGQDLFDKFMCYCKNGAGDLQTSISAADTKIPQVESNINAGIAEKTQLDADLQNHKSDRDAANSAMASANALRDKEHKAFSAMKAEADSNIAAIAKAVTAIDNGMSGSFLQTGGAQVLRKLFQTQDMSDIDREDVMAFLAGGAQQGAAYVPQSGQISGILKQLGDDMSKNLADATQSENDSTANFEGLMAAKTKEVSALTASIEEKTVRSGEVAVSIVQMKEDLTDTQAALLEDKKFLADMSKNCASKEAEWAAISKTRSEELVALAETITLLNDDDALELFKKTLPSASASFVQVEAGTANLKRRAVAVIRAAQSKIGKADRHQLDVIMIALKGKAGSFDKVLKMIDELVAQLKVEQTNDDGKKIYCEKQLDESDDKKKGLEQSISDNEKSAADAQDRIATLASEIKALEESISALDTSVADATAQRQKEHDEFTELMASNTAAVKLIGVAKNRMNQFYNPSLHVAAAKRELSEEDRIAVNMGGTAPPTPAPGGIAGTGITYVQVSAHMQLDDAPAPPPDAPTYSQKSEESTGVIAMMDMLIADLDKEMTESQTEEKDAQADYEQMSSDAAAKRIADTSSIAEKVSAKANTEAELQHANDEKAANTNELMATAEYIAGLHAECDWLVSNFAVRKEARANEVESLKNAKSVLSGADFALLQTQTRSLRGQA